MAHDIPFETSTLFEALGKSKSQINIIIIIINYYCYFILQVAALAKNIPK